MKKRLVLWKKSQILLSNYRDRLKVFLESAPHNSSTTVIQNDHRNIVDKNLWKITTNISANSLRGFSFTIYQQYCQEKFGIRESAART